MSFTKELKSAINESTRINDQVWRASVVDAFNQVVLATPVGNPSLWMNPAPPGYVGGSARQSWLIGDSNDGAIGQAQLNAQPGDIPALGGSVLLYSNIPYIERLEDGWSYRQAPEGMVKGVVARWDKIVKVNDEQFGR